MFKKLFDTVRDAVRNLKERNRSKQIEKQFEKDGRPVIKVREVIYRFRQKKTLKRDRPRMKPTAAEKAALMYPPGTLIEMPSGATYKVSAAGNWVRVSLKPGERKEIIKWQSTGIRNTTSQTTEKTSLPQSSC